ncbi:uncharacterized protein LOC125725517 [Brienomyrus brachyistius]|uniref:uncharacterized protein LOC125725517 n=1 Tax=Brienomyrus brachyistius TaxID=42636 RepID=UPI0020B27EEB|nr:uncharacterized protein LOC125725517 [Brienomyrus brachyistius]
MGDLDERLCEAVRRNPHIYNASLKEHRDIFLCGNSWKQIAQTLGKDESYCRVRWKYLRDRYVKAKRKTAGRRGNKSSPILAMLSWLSSYVSHRDSDSNVASDMMEGSSEAVTQAGPPRKNPRAATKLFQLGPHDVQPLPPGPPPGSGPGTTSPVVPRKRQPQTLESECLTSGPSVTDMEQETFSENLCLPPRSPSPSEMSDQSSLESPFHHCQRSGKRKECQTSLTEAVMLRLQKIDEEGGCEELSFGRYIGQTLLKMDQKTRSCVKFEISRVLHKWEMEPHRDEVV